MVLMIHGEEESAAVQTGKNQELAPTVEPFHARKVAVLLITFFFPGFILDTVIAIAIISSSVMV